MNCISCPAFVQGRSGDNMKLNQDYIAHETDGEILLVSSNAASFNGLFQGNETTAFIINCLREDTTEHAIVSALAAEYSGNIEEMREDVSKTLSELRRIGALSD